MILLFILSIVLTYTSVPETIVAPAIIVITGISIFIGSQITTTRIKKNGIMNGGVIGLIYILFIYFLSSILTGTFGLSIYSFIMIICSIFAGMLGGIIGVNKK